MDKEELKRINPQIVKNDGTIPTMAEQYRMWETYQFNISYPMIVSVSSKSMGLGQIEDLPIVLNTKTIVKCRKGKKSSHFLSPQMFKGLSKHLEEHICSLDSKTRADSVLLILQEKDYKNDPIVVSLALGKNIRGEKVHLITSIYGRHKFSAWLKSSIAAGCRIYKNTKKERSLNDIGVQFSHQIEISLSGNKFNKEEEKSQEQKGETTMKEPQFAAIVTDLNQYAKGHLKGKWITFPTSEQHLQEALDSLSGSEGEYFLSDYATTNTPFLEGVLGEYENLTELNLLAALLEKHEQEKEKIGAYLESSSSRSVQEICNVVVQADQIEYAPYDFKGIEHLKEQGESVETLYGYTLAEKNGIYEQLQKMNMINYVDFESYGRDEAVNGNVHLMKNGYLNLPNCNINPKAYSMQELMKEGGLEKGKEKTPEVAPRL